MLLTLRASGLRAHSNQWALPGGRCDAGETPVAAALRELDEEIGLRLGTEHVLGILDDYPTRSGYLITPVVVWAADGTRLRSTRTRSPPCTALRWRNPARRRVRLHRHSGKRAAGDPVSLRGDFIHAPTAALIYQFREMLAGRHTRVADLEQPVFAWK